MSFHDHRLAIDKLIFGRRVSRCTIRLCSRWRSYQDPPGVHCPGDERVD